MGGKLVGFFKFTDEAFGAAGVALFLFLIMNGSIVFSYHRLGGMFDVGNLSVFVCLLELRRIE